MSQAGSRHARHESEPVLVDAVRELSQRIDALQAEVRRLAAPGLPPLVPADDGLPEAERFAWIAALEPPVRRAPRVPRLLLESLFLLATALGAGLARLDALVVVGVMGGAWALVALLEWTALRASRGEALAARAVQAGPPPAPAAADPAWLVPPVQPTVLEPPPESPTTVAPLPPRSGGPEVTVEGTPAA